MWILVTVVGEGQEIARSLENFKHLVVSRTPSRLFQNRNTYQRFGNLSVVKVTAMVIQGTISIKTMSLAGKVIIKSVTRGRMHATSP